MRAAGRFEVAIRIARIVVRICESIPVVEEKLHRFNGNGKPKAFTESDLHVRDADDFARQVKQGAATVARIDLRRGLQIQFAAELPRFRAENAFGDRALETERTAHCKYSFADRERIRVAQIGRASCRE